MKVNSFCKCGSANLSDIYTSKNVIPEGRSLALCTGSRTLFLLTDTNLSSVNSTTGPIKYHGHRGG